MANMTEKILFSKVGHSFRTGETVFSKVDGAMMHDVGTAGVSPLLDKMGLEKLPKDIETVVILDHFVPACTVTHSKSHVIAREFVRKWKVKNFYEIGRGGICHQVMLEDGFARSGNLVIATDAHVTTYGGVGCLGLGVGVTDVAMALVTGKMWIRVPETIGIEIEGNLNGNATAKDLSIKILSDIPFSILNYAVVEIYGPAVHGLSMDERFCLCNMLSEGGVKSCLVECDDETERYMKEHANGKGYRLVSPDPDATYDYRYHYNLSDVRPMVSVPHHPTNGILLEKLPKTAVNQAFIGSCTNGRMDDLRIAASILKGKRINDNVRLIITPSSQKVYRQAMKEGLIDIFIDSGALITNPSCGACLGASSVLAPNEVCVSTSNRNFQGRMGSVEASIYLASPSTVAYSALAGFITGGEV